MGQSYLYDPYKPVKECGTPDARYSFNNINGKVVRFGVTFPVPMLAVKHEQEFFNEMHAAMLPVVERLYERMWKQCFAGTLDAEGRLYPDNYRDLWPKDAPAGRGGG